MAAEMPWEGGHDAKAFFDGLAQKVADAGFEEEFDSFSDVYFNSNCDVEALRAKMAPFAEKIGASIHSCFMLFFFLAAERIKPKYDERGVSDEVFFDTFSDLRYKAYECVEEHGVWGTFVEGWYSLFYRCEIIKFGRFEYQDIEYDSDTPYSFGDVTLNKGDKLLSIHIPSSGEPFDLKGRLESYKRAYDFYSKELNTDKLVCECNSWLLYPTYREILGEKSNVSDFMSDFDMVKTFDQDKFGDDWRVFGRDHSKPVEEYPENTRMRRAFKKHLLSGGKVGCGLGYVVYDGENLLTRK